MSISAVLATHNEAVNLERCLQAVKGLTDEIIMVDGESTDETVQLAQKLGARVISTTNKTNFHINKQMAMDAAKGELVLQLDADEVVDRELRDFILELKNQIEVGTLPKQPVAWSIKRKNHLFGRWLSKGGQYPDAVIRLYLNGKARLPQIDVHEQMEVDGEVGEATGHLLHYSYPTFSEYVRKFNTYTSFAAEQLFDREGEASKPPSAVRYLLLNPAATFFSLYIRHRGYVDGMAGFVFAFMSALHHPFVYLKYWEQLEKHRLAAQNSVK